MRLEAYRRLAAVRTEAEIEDVRTEWEDRFGPLPPPARALLDVARLRVECLRLGITDVAVAVPRPAHGVRGPAVRPRPGHSQAVPGVAARLGRGAVAPAGPRWPPISPISIGCFVPMPLPRQGSEFAPALVALVTDP